MIINFILVLLLIALVISKVKIHLKYLMFVIVCLFLIVKSIPDKKVIEKFNNLNSNAHSVIRKVIGNDTYTCDNIDLLIDKFKILSIYDKKKFYPEPNDFSHKNFNDTVELGKMLILKYFENESINCDKIIKLSESIDLNDLNHFFKE